MVGECFIQSQPEPDGFQVGKVIGREHLALNDREVDLHLIQPTGMDRGMDQRNTRIDLAQALLGRFAAMRRAVVHNPEQALVAGSY